MDQWISYYFVTKITFRSHLGDWKIQIIAPSEPKVCIFSTHFFVHRYAHLIRKVPTNLHSYQNHFKISISKSNIQVLQLLPDFTTKIFPQLTRFHLTRYFQFLKISVIRGPPVLRLRNHGLAVKIFYQVTTGFTNNKQTGKKIWR